MKIAIEGCAHGELEKIYEYIENHEKKNQFKVDLLICCGDFQATRNEYDLECMAIPRKFYDMCTFHKYYSGEKIAPILTIFIGGNHEASNYLQELPYGGWVAPNIYYMGYAGVININGIRIAGISGIFKRPNYLKGRFEFAPYNENTKRSVYHIRNLDVFRLKQLSKPIDIFISHDWPKGIYNFGNFQQLIRFKPHFREEIASNSLGSPPLEELLHHLQPTRWFSAHLHCKFVATFNHKDDGKTTEFLALDKCLPKRKFLQIIDVKDSNKGVQIEYDLEWLTILNLTNHLVSVKDQSNFLPDSTCDKRYDFTPTEDEKNFILKKIKDLKVPLNFKRTAEPYTPSKPKQYLSQPKAVINSQTTLLCEKLNIDDPVSLAKIMAGEELNESTYEDLKFSFSSNITDSSLLSFSNESNISTPAKRSLSESLPKPKELDGEYLLQSSNSKERNLDDDSIIENFDNKWKDVRTPHKSMNSSILNNETTLTASFEPSFSNSDDATRLNCETKCERPVKKFKRRNESIYNNSDS